MLVNDEFFMQQALREAQKAFDADEIPIGAIIVINQKIVARAYNQTEQLNDATAHAEILALTSAFTYLGSKYLTDATLYVTVEPCLMCAGAMFWSKLDRIVWGADDDKNGYKHITQTNSPFHPKTKIRTGVLKNECAALMKEFFQQKR